ncbi:MAG: hypothetical protein OEY79_00435 [Anaplasmataceae bacterium]|nr:hypothetical protein [Anaplasmataceae bacterium]
MEKENNVIIYSSFFRRFLPFVLDLILSLVVFILIIVCIPDRSLGILSHSMGVIYYVGIIPCIHVILSLKLMSCTISQRLFGIIILDEVTLQTISLKHIVKFFFILMCIGGIVFLLFIATFFLFANFKSLVLALFPIILLGFILLKKFFNNKIRSLIDVLSGIITVDRSNWKEYNQSKLNDS